MDSHGFWCLNPDTTALVVIDVQNDFCAKGGYFNKTGTDVSHIGEAVRRLLGLIKTARESGALVIFVRNFYDPVYLSEVQTAQRRRVGWEFPLCREGTWGAEFFMVTPLPEDVVVTKHRYDALYGTNLELILRTNGIRTLVLTGVATNTCVETTLRSAFVRDFEVILVADCSAARKRHLHENTLETVRQLFGLVASADDIEAVWKQRASSAGTPTHAV